MPNPDQLYIDMQKLDDLYEELLWDPDDELQFTHDGHKIIITNKTQENKQWTKKQNAGTDEPQWLDSSLPSVHTSPQVRSFLESGDLHNPRKGVF